MKTDALLNLDNQEGLRDTISLNESCPESFELVCFTHRSKAEQKHLGRGSAHGHSDVLTSLSCLCTFPLAVRLPMKGGRSEPLSLTVCTESFYNLRVTCLPSTDKMYNGITYSKVLLSTKNFP